MIIIMSISKMYIQETLDKCHLTDIKLAFFEGTTVSTSFTHILYLCIKFIEFYRNRNVLKVTEVKMQETIIIYIHSRHIVGCAIRSCASDNYWYGF